MLVTIVGLRDATQGAAELKQPEIRVWCHPHKIGGSGDDWYEVFNSFREAQDFIKTHKEAEDTPLIAINGYELNIFDFDGYNECLPGVKGKTNGGKNTACDLCA